MKITNKTKTLLTVNLGGRSVHLLPRSSEEITDAESKTSEVVKHVARGRLAVNEDPPKKAVRKKTAAPSPKPKADVAEKKTVADGKSEN